MLKSVGEDRSFPPLGLVPSDFPHGLRRGLHSYAASRLRRGALFSARRRNFIIGLTQPLERWVADILLLGSTLQGSAKAR